MAENGNGNGERIQKAVDNAVLTVIARYASIATAAIGTAMGGLIWWEVSNFVTEARQAHSDLVKAINGLDIRQSIVETRVEQLEKGRR